MYIIYTEEDDGGISEEAEGHTQSSFHSATVGPHSVVRNLRSRYNNRLTQMYIHFGEPLSLGYILLGDTKVSLLVKCTKKKVSLLVECIKEHEIINKLLDTGQLSNCSNMFSCGGQEMFYKRGNFAAFCQRLALHSSC